MKLIKITAIWCLSCILMNDRINNILKESNIEIEELDYDDDEEKIENFAIGKTLPVLILLDENNNEIRRSIGEKSEKELKEFIKGSV
ncbi:MAG: thioredoxin domain-containing protein [Bacilli bacterium]|nr:thioredoxin domain-containing protein [Bacilli bacterium]